MSKQRWKEGDRVLIKAVKGDLLQTQVVYCEILPSGTFAIGLRRLTAEGRWHLRVECSGPVRIRPAEDSTDHTEDVCYTQNISRDGLYFTSGHLGYHEGMRLLIRFLQHLDFSASDTDHIGQVARLDHGKDGRMGVAVKLLEPITWQTAYDGQGRVVVVRLRKAGRKSSKTAPASVTELTVHEMKDAPRTA
jgi:hypothetical protein